MAQVMKLIRSIPSLRREILRARHAGRVIAFVPTMGALHEGHVSLMRRARRIAGRRGLVVTSIFVNPTQFNQKSDFEKYPHTLTSDCRKCRAAGVDLVFAPSPHAMYPDGFSTWVNEESLSLPLCGASRPGHFRGVCTVVLKLFNLVQPDVAIFGQKDAQQALVIRRMVRDLDVPVRIVVAPIVRERDGLAMSSRNARLSPAERGHALALSAGLRDARKAFRSGKQGAASLKRMVRRSIARSPGLKADYVALVDTATLRPVKHASRGDLLAVAAWVGATRLIDNIQM